MKKLVYGSADFSKHFSEDIDELLENILRNKQERMILSRSLKVKPDMKMAYFYGVLDGLEIVKMELPDIEKLYKYIIYQGTTKIPETMSDIYNRAAEIVDEKGLPDSGLAPW